MAAPRRAARPEQAPDDLAGKRPATLSAVQAEARAEQTIDENGAVLVTLTTRNGSHDMQVPPYDEWTSVARNALNRNDDLTWAQRTLSPVDAMAWMRLDPTLKEMGVFFESWAAAIGQNLGE